MFDLSSIYSQCHLVELFFTTFLPLAGAFPFLVVTTTSLVLVPLLETGRPLELAPCPIAASFTFFVLPLFFSGCSSTTIWCGLASPPRLFFSISAATALRDSYSGPVEARVGGFLSSSCGLVPFLI